MLRSEFTDRFVSEDALTHSVRRYYLLLPAKASIGGWSELHKTNRRRLIRTHLEAICVSGSVTSAQVKEIDSWLTNRESSRELLSLYGRQLQARYGKLCFLCGSRIEDRLTVDHMFPVSRGGDSSVENLVLAHPRCNSSKGARMPGEGIRWAPTALTAEIADVPLPLRFFVYLRDDFSCTEASCERGIRNGSEIDLKRKTETGVVCYDNLRTVCTDCSPRQIQSDEIP